MSETVNDTIGDFVQMFAGGITHGTLYFKDHPRVREMAERTVAALRDHFAAAARSSAAPVQTLFIGIARGRLVADGKPLLGALLAARRLIDFLRRLRSGGFLLKSTTDADQLRNLFAFGHELGGEVPTLDDARRMLAERGILAVELSPPYGEPGWLGVPIGGGGEEIPLELDGSSATVTCVQQLHDGVEVAHAAVAQGRVPDVGNLQATIGRVLHQLLTDLPRALEMAYYADYDRYVIGHSVRVGLFATLIARSLALDEARVAEVLCGALLHDVGKARVPAALLYRRGPLAEDEREQMELHAEDGAELLAASQSTTPLILEIVLAHHVRQDGRGYPALPSGIPPTIWGPLLYVVDVFEALTAVRPYQKRRTPKRAYEILAADRGGSRADALALFARAVGLHPAGGHVRLGKGEVGRVLGATRVFDRPRLELMYDAAGQRIARDRNAKVDAAQVDLSLPKSEDLVIAEYLFEPLELGITVPVEPTGPPVEPSPTP
jgi:putative nucleotidyltransferase with HDIG domain